MSSHKQSISPWTARQAASRCLISQVPRKLTMPLPYPPPFMDIDTLSQHCCLSPDTIEAHVKQGIFPSPRKQGGKRLWSWARVQRHLAPADNQVPTSPTDQVREITNAVRKEIENA